jgi:hypothetical protein
MRHAVVEDAVRAIAQLTRLRSLKLEQTPTFSDVQLAQLSTLSRLTKLAIWGGDLLPLNPTLQHASFAISNPVITYDACAVAVPMPLPADTAAAAESLAGAEHAMLPPLLLQGAPTSV